MRCDVRKILANPEERRKLIDGAVMFICTFAREQVCRTNPKQKPGTPGKSSK